MEPAPRELTYALTHAGRVLSITVQRQRGGRLVDLTTTYAVERPGGLVGVVNLVKENGEVVEVTRWTCSCRDAWFRGRGRVCKHRQACLDLELL